MSRAAQPSPLQAARTIGAVPAYDRRSKRQRAAPDPIARYLGDVQAELMTTFWEKGSATVREIVDVLNKRRKPPLAYTTVLTLISRLWSRGLLARVPEGRGFRYQPTKSREELLGVLSDELIDRLFSDFGEIAVARLGARLDKLDRKQRSKLAEARKRDG